MKCIITIVGLGVIAIIAIGASIIYAFYMLLPDSKARTADGALMTVSHEGRGIEYHVRGDGPRVMLMASAGREASDFNELTAELVEAGYRTIAIEAPGIGGTDMTGGNTDLYDLSEDVMAVLDADCGDEIDCRTSIVGHAFGNRVARATASRNPQRIHGVVLIAAGGRNEIDEHANQALFNAFDPRRTREQRKEDIRYAFFAAGNPIPDYWIRGWHRNTATMQGSASRNTPDDVWLAGGEGPMLVVQADSDRLAPKEDTSDVIEAEYGDRVAVALIENAGHALLPERPTAIGQAVVNFLDTIWQPVEQTP